METSLGSQGTVDVAQAVKTILEEGHAQTVPRAKIVVPSWQPRQRIDKVRLDNLASSMAAVGQGRAITVCPVDGKDTFELLGGQRRFLAGGKAGFTELTALVVSIPEGPQARTIKRAIAAMDNTAQEPLDVVDAINEAKGMADDGLSTAQIAAFTGKSILTIQRYLAIAANLHAGLMAKLRPGAGKRISLGVAAELTRVRKGFQPEALQHIRARGGGEQVAKAVLDGMVGDSLPKPGRETVEVLLRRLSAGLKQATSSAEALVEQQAHLGSVTPARRTTALAAIRESLAAFERVRPLLENAS